MQLNYAKKTIYLILLSTLVRCIIAFTVELGNDEVYYRLFASHLQWNYFDHPPIVGWLIRATTFNLLLDTDFFIRLGAIIAAAITTWLMYRCGEKLLNTYTGFLAALIYTATIYGSIIAGTFILPDSPQMVCWVSALYLLISITGAGNIGPQKKKELIGFGVICGLGMLCKIHTAFLWIGFIVFVLFYNREWLTKTVLYLSAIITLLFFIPVIAWNIHNDFITFLYHGKRVNVASGGIDVDSFLTFMAGQFFYCNPVIFILMLRTLWFKKNIVSLSQQRILLLTSLPLIVTAIAISFFKTVLPHWTGPAYSSLILLTACYFGTREALGDIKKRKIPTVLTIANGLLFLVITAGILTINFYPGTLGSKDRQNRGEGDFTLDLYGWKKAAASFDSIYLSKHTNSSSGSTIILADKWFPAAHIEHYFGKPLGLYVTATGPIEDIHQYYWLNKQRPFLKDTAEIFIVVPSNYDGSVEKYGLASRYKASKPDTIVQYRGKEEARRFYIYYYKK